MYRASGTRIDSMCCYSLGSRMGKGNEVCCKQNMPNRPTKPRLFHLFHTMWAWILSDLAPIAFDASLTHCQWIARFMVLALGWRLEVAERCEKLLANISKYND